METTQGNKTSEYRITLLSQLIGMALVAVGIVDPTELDTISQHLILIIGGLGTVFTSIMYIYSRTVVKAPVVPRIQLDLEKVDDVGTGTVG